MGKIRPVVFILAVCGASLFIVSYLNLRILTEKDFAEKRAEKNAQVEVVNYNNTLDTINEYQKKYFDIIQKNDVLLLSESTEEIKEDEKALENLFNDVKSQISSVNPYLPRYNQIEQKFLYNSGENTYDMNNFAQKKYEAVDGLLNEVYQAVMSTISDNDKKLLKKSELKWLEKVEEYNKVFESKDYGTISYLVKSGYECNMRSFRTLLLMLYLN